MAIIDTSSWSGSEPGSRLLAEGNSMGHLTQAVSCGLWWTPLAGVEANQDPGC